MWWANYCTHDYVTPVILENYQTCCKVEATVTENVIGTCHSSECVLLCFGIYMYLIFSIRRLGVNQQIVCCVPDVTRSRSVNLNVEFCRLLEPITSTPPGVKLSRGV